MFTTPTSLFLCHETTSENVVLETYTVRDLSGHRRVCRERTGMVDTTATQKEIRTRDKGINVVTNVEHVSLIKWTNNRKTKLSYLQDVPVLT